MLSLKHHFISSQAKTIIQNFPTLTQAIIAKTLTAHEQYTQSESEQVVPTEKQYDNALNGPYHAFFYLTF